jgi:hypothetical protein
MQLAASGFIDALRGAPGSRALPPGPLQVANPTMDPIVEQQGRFRVSGTGPLSQRDLEPATAATRAMVAKGPELEQAVRRVLKVVESTAGGPEASEALEVNGVALSASPQGYAAITYRARMDDDLVLREIAAGKGPAGMRDLGNTMARQAFAETNGTIANVVGGWMNLGPGATTGMIAPQGTVAMDALADTVRTVRHESAHLVDDVRPGLSRDANSVLYEAVAEHHSTTLPQLQQARHDLGLDAAVTDAALSASLLRIRPYRAYEERVTKLLDVAGIRGADADALVERGSKAVVEALEQRLVADGTPAPKARSIIEGALANVHGRVGTA